MHPGGSLTGCGGAPFAAGGFAPGCAVPLARRGAASLHGVSYRTRRAVVTPRRLPGCAVIPSSPGHVTRARASRLLSRRGPLLGAQPAPVASTPLPCNNDADDLGRLPLNVGSRPSCTQRLLARALLTGLCPQAPSGASTQPGWGAHRAAGPIAMWAGAWHELQATPTGVPGAPCGLVGRRGMLRVLGSTPADPPGPHRGSRRSAISEGGVL